MQMDRRQVLVGGAAAALPLSPEGFFARHRLLIGLQLYSIYPLLQADFDGSLMAVRQLGFGEVELAGFKSRTPKQIRQGLDRANLICRSAHIQPTKADADPSLADDLGILADAMHTIGVTTVVVPVPLVPQRLGAGGVTGDPIAPEVAQMTLDDWRTMADFLTDRGRALARFGLSIAYHNHNFDFAKFGGLSALEVLLANTDPTVVSFELDAGWAAAAGRDPAALLERHPGRFKMMHVKDIDRKTPPNLVLRQDPADLGEGKIAWPRLLTTAYRSGVRRFYVEREGPFLGSRLDAIGKDARFLAAVR